MNNMPPIEFWSTLNKNSKLIENQMDDLTRKRTGSYYTDLELTDVMINELIEQLKNTNKTKELYKYRFLEPCVGTGNFVFSYIKVISSNGISPQNAQIMLDNIYVADINTDALNSYKQNLKKIASLLWNIELSEEYFKQHIGTGLLINVATKDPKYTDIKNVFSAEILGEGFDIIATNPPYKNLKAERKHYKNEKEYYDDKNKYSKISEIISKNFQYSINGTLNLYKLFIEEIIDRYSNKNAFISLLVPSAILTDKTSENIRTHLLKDNQLLSIKIIKENNAYINAKQGLAAILLKKGNKTDKISIIKDYCNNPENITTVSIEDILNENTGNSIIPISHSEYFLLKKLRQYPTVKDLPFIINLRGELDLTLNKNNIINKDSKHRLIKGRNISYYNLIETKEKEFVSNEFIKQTNKRCYIEQERIACQQIVNINKERRISFCFIPKNYVLGNSCNFISVNENSYGIDIYTLLGLFNTKIINWYFKLNSSNNHINNYEIDNFPIPINSLELKHISSLAKKFLKEKDATILEKIEELTYKAYGISINIEEKIDKNKYIKEYTKSLQYILPHITINETKDILEGKIKIDNYFNNLNKFDINVIKGITLKYTALLKNQILNHTTFKLSDLDLEMIKDIPPGGNWKNIPEETVKKSKRLKKITQTGGRTTLYGRIDYDKPSYTITTYFNRPGNGTYIHPVHNRVLSVREAARFQTFKDDYYFFGNKTQLLKQVGNAVPTLLAYQIAKQIKEKTDCSTSIDLFCGAGGMTVGFKTGGIKSLLSNDIEESACITLKINNPEINVLCGDITKSEIKDVIRQVATDNNVDIICGGPPCQGFSMAGYRLENDPRNQLFRDFIDVVKNINPKIIVFENVEGLLSYQKGKTYNEIHKLFTEIGYKTEGKVLIASDYAIPQKRKRVIIICVRNDLFVSPNDLFPPPITQNKAQQITARETIFDLEKIDCDEKAMNSINDVESDILKFFKGKITDEEYINLKI